MAVLDYIELPARSVARQTDFYSKAFGWVFTPYGDTYAAHERDPCQFALNGTGHHQSDAALPVVRVDDIQSSYDAVKAAGGTITLEIFDFPGGKRFHFTDPEGQQLGVYEPSTE